MVKDDGPVGLDGLKVAFDDERPSPAPAWRWWRRLRDDSDSRPGRAAGATARAAGGGGLNLLPAKFKQKVS